MLEVVYQLHHENFKTIILIITLLVSKTAYSYCNLEIVKIGSSIKELTNKTKLIQDIKIFNNEPFMHSIPVEEICKDKKFKMFPINFIYINKKLHQIFIEDLNNNINHLKNLKKFFNNPTEIYEAVDNKGLSYYHWDLKTKLIFLVIKQDENFKIQNIEIVSNKFPELMEKYNENLEE